MYIIKHYLMKYTMIFMCKYSNEMMTSIKAIEFKYFTIGLEFGEGNVFIAFHFHKCELKEKTPGYSKVTTHFTITLLPQGISHALVCQLV